MKGSNKINFLPRNALNVFLQSKEITYNYVKKFGVHIIKNKLSR